MVFSDSTFNLANYTSSPVFTTAGTTLTTDQCANCGNPGQGLQLIAAFPVNGGSASVGLANTTFSYDPMTQGAIASISASVDKDLSASMDDNGGGNTFHPLIEQDGNFYLASIPGPLLFITTGYNTLSKGGLVASNFQEYDFATNSFVAGNPNFAGDPMLFGLGQLFGLPSPNPAITFEADYDNLHLTVVNTVPEPASILLLGAGIAGLAGLRRRTRT